MKTIAYFILISICTGFISCQQNNFSDEVIDEFLSLDKNIKKNNIIIQRSTESVIAYMEEKAKTRLQYAPVTRKAKEIDQLSDSLDHFIEALRTSLIEESGGIYNKTEALSLQHPHLEGIAKGLKDKTIVETILLNDDYSEYSNISQAELLYQKIETLKEQYIHIIEGIWKNGGIKGTIFADPSKKGRVINELKEELTIISLMDYVNNNQNLSWAEFLFGNRPLVAVLAQLQVIKNKIWQSESACINFLASQYSSSCGGYDKFDVFAQSSKPSIKLGETYQADIALGTYSSKSIFSVTVNGDTINAIDGKATYRVRPKTTGEQYYNARIAVKNPSTGEIETFTKQFYFEVIK